MTPTRTVQAVPDEQHWDTPIASVDWVNDGDTLEATMRSRLDHGFGLWVVSESKQSLRLLGVDAPETDDKPRWTAAREAVIAWCRSHGGLHAVTFKPPGRSPVPTGKFGRWLADVQDANGASLSDHLLANDFAGPWARSTWLREAPRQASTYWDRRHAATQA